MKRDMDLCIKLLKLVQSHPRASVSVQSHEEVTEAMRNGSLPEGREQKIVEAPRDCDTDKLEYHIDLLTQADLLNKDPLQQGWGPENWRKVEVTFSGHDFLDNLNQEGVMAVLKAKFGKELSGVSLAVLIQFTTKTAVELAGKLLT